MLSPESFVRFHKRHVTDVIRVALERRGILGFIETHESMTLREARQLIWENVERAPCDFHFVLDDGVPVSARQEITQRVMQFYPCLKICEGTKPLAMATAPPVVSFTQRDCGGSTGISNSSTEKISVWTSSGDEFTVWISEDYTFQQLRRDAARYWNLSPGQAVLVDRDGCLWPEQAKILAVMGIEELLDRKIVLESKASASTTTKPRSTAMALTRTLTIIPSRRRFSMGDATPSTSGTLANSHDVLSHHTVVGNPVEELWRVFTFYCVNGDSLELECIRAHQFNRLLRDAQVLGTTVTPAMAAIIYTSETKGKPQASGKMSFDEFLNALIKVALAQHRKSSSHKQLLRTANDDTQEQDELLQRLIAECILPRASRWPTHAWDLQTQHLRHVDIVGFIATFLDPLLDLFAFYAKSHLLQASAGAKQFYMAYADYQRFVNDFAVADLQISSVEAAQVFIASCASTPVHETLSGADRSMSSPRSPTLVSKYQCEELSCSSVSSSSFTARMSVTSVFFKLAQSAEGAVLFLSPAAQIGRLSMSFSAFLDTLGRLGLVAFAKTKAGKLNALQSVKAVFHHMSRGLTQSRVLDIVATHGSASIHAGRFYSGSVAFNNKFLDMWRYEGSPDYLAVGVAGGDLSGTWTAAMPLNPTVAENKLTRATTPLSPSRRLTSSAALFDERVVMNGAGRGREALDRLVRNAFIRNSAAAATTVESAVPVESTLTKEDRVLLADITSDVAFAGENQRAHPSSKDQPLPRSMDEDPSATQAGDASPLPLHTVGKPVVSFLSSELPLCPHDERSLFESILLKGGVFKKYDQWGSPRRRFVWCSKEFDGIYWRPINKKHSLTKDGLPVVSLVAVLPGNSQRTRYAFMKHLSDEKSLSRCFSLVAEDRRLNLEADSEASRDLWIQALKFLIRDRRSRIPVPAT